MMKAISKAEAITYCSKHLSDWTVTDKAIRRDFVFRNFVEAFSFMAAVALEAEKMDHHPDWSNGYNRVSIELSTHSEGGVTGNDLELAGKIDKIYGNFRKGDG